MRSLCSVLAALFFFATFSQTEASIIASFNQNITSGSSSTYLHLSIPVALNAPSIFDDILITIPSLGQTFSATASNESQFAAVATRLTNGVDEILWAGSRTGPNQTGGGGASGDLESVRFASLSNPAPDLAGFTLSSIDMRVNSMTQTGPQTFSWNATFTFHGDSVISGNSVPEPGTMTVWSLAALGGAAAVARRKRVA